MRQSRVLAGPTGMAKRIIFQDVYREGKYLQDWHKQAGDMWLKDEWLL